MKWKETSLFASILVVFIWVQMPERNQDDDEDDDEDDEDGAEGKRRKTWIQKELGWSSKSDEKDGLKEKQRTQEE